MEKECNLPVAPFPPVKLWALEYKCLSDPQYAGVAVLSAPDAGVAERLFKAESRHNGEQNKLKVVGIEEIHPQDKALLYEVYIKVYEHNVVSPE